MQLSKLDFQEIHMLRILKFNIFQKEAAVSRTKKVNKGT